MHNGIFSWIILCVFWTTTYLAQNELGTIAFALVMPDKIEKFDQNQFLKLESKIIQAAANVGIAGKGFYSDFVLYPVVTFNDLEVNSQSMKTQYSLSIEFGLFIKSIADGRIYASYSETLTGIGSSEYSALSNALNGLNPKSKILSVFFQDAVSKIIEYVDSKCDDFISKADAQAKMGKYEESIALLMSIPDCVPKCFEKVKNKSIEIYKLHLKKSCNALILSIKGNIATGAINEVISELNLIDPTSPCYEEADELVEKLKRDLDKKERMVFEREMEVYKSELELAKLKINNMKEIALAYYKSKPTMYNYYEVVRR